MAFGISVNANKFRRNLMLLAAQNSAKEEIWPIFNQLGEGRMRALMDKGEPFLETIPLDQLPPKLQGWLAQAPQFRNWITDLDETVILALLPPWLQELVMRNEESKKWFLREAEWIRARFDPPAAPAAPPRPHRVFRAISKQEVTDGRREAGPGQDLQGTIEQPG